MTNFCNKIVVKNYDILAYLMVGQNVMFGIAVCSKVVKFILNKFY